MATGPVRPAAMARPAKGAVEPGEAEQPGYACGLLGFVAFSADSVREWLSRNAMQMAAAIAFYSFFSLFPLSVLIILGYDLFSPAGEIPQDQLVRVIGTFIPVSQGVIAETIQSVADRWDWRATGPLALAGLIWASTAVFATLRKGINATWGIWKPRPFLEERVIDLSLTAGAGVLLMALLFSVSVLRSFSRTDGVLGGPAWTSLLSLALTFGAFSLLYWFLPNRPLRFRNVLFGAATAAVAFEAAKGLFLFYTASRQGINHVYGDFTSVAVLLGWLYVSAVIILVGSLITVVYTGVVQRRIAGDADIWSFGLVPIARRIRKRVSWRVPLARGR